MSTPTTPIGSSPLPAYTIPLTPAAKAAYQDLYIKIQTAIDSTMDLATVEALNQAWPQIDQVLTEDGEYTLTHNTNIFASLQQQIKTTNDSITQLRTQIAAIASHFAMAGEIIAAINKVLSVMMPA
jgi:septal ring factor EnvC (AmiA/AmiB activator)